MYHSLNGEIDALQNINFSVSEGEFISIVGPSGCGKSTLLSLIAGLMAPPTGVLGPEIRRTLNQETKEYALKLLAT